MMINNSYYINQLDIGSGTNKYVEIDAIDGSVELLGNKWLFDLYFYVVTNSNLPQNMLEYSLSLPFARLDNISLSKSLTDVPDWVNRRQCQSYHSFFEIDVSTANLQTQKLTNYQMFMNFCFNVNPDVINNNTFDSPNTHINQFINEWSEQQKRLDFLYTNYVELSDMNWFDINNTFYLNSRFGSSSYAQLLYYSMNEQTNELEEPLRKLISITSAIDFTIINSKVTFNYQINEDKKIQTFEYSDSTTRFINKNTDIVVGLKTYYDPITQKITIDNNGNEGIFITDNAIGFYTIELTIGYRNNYRVFRFNKPFSFKATNREWNVNIKPIFIKNIDNTFMEISY